MKQSPRYWSAENVAPWLEKFFTFQRDTHPVWFDYIVSTNKKHGWHLVSRSPWPFWASCSALTLVMGLIFWMHKFNGLFKYNPVTVPSYLLWYGLFAVAGVIIFWFRDIIREAVYMGYHTTFVQSNLRVGFILFIVSEVMFFASFFWAFFHSSIDPSIWNGSIWPPSGIVNFFISEDISQLLMLPSLAALAETFSTYLPSVLKGDFYSPIIAEINNIAGFITSNYTVYYSDKLAAFADKWGISWYIFNDADINTLFSNLDAEDMHDLVSVVFNASFDGSYDIISEKNTSLSLASELSENDSSFANNSLYVDKSVGSTDLNSNSLNLNLYDSGTLIKPYRLPLINTFILLTSGAFLTWSHKSLRVESFKEALGSLGGVILFAAAFVIVQFHEYLLSAFSINDGIFGSTFFMLTGFHGIHVMVGSIFLIVCAFRFLLIHFTRANHFGYEAAIWYWHFVDVIWVFLYLFVYFWPSNFFFDYSFNWNSFLSTSFDFALPTKFLTYLTDTVLDYPFPLVEKYAEIKADVFKRFSLSVPSLIAISGADFASPPVDPVLSAVKSFLHLTDSNILISRLHIGYEDTMMYYGDDDSFISEFEILDGDTVFEGNVFPDQTESNFIASVSNKIVSWIVAKYESCAEFFNKNSISLINLYNNNNFILQGKSTDFDFEFQNDVDTGVLNTEEPSPHDHFYYTLDSITGLEDVTGESTEEGAYGISGAEIERLIHGENSKTGYESVGSSAVNEKESEVVSKNNNSSLNDVDDWAFQKNAVNNFLSQDSDTHLFANDDAQLAPTGENSNGIPDSAEKCAVFAEGEGTSEIRIYTFAESTNRQRLNVCSPWFSMTMSYPADAVPTKENIRIDKIIYADGLVLEHAMQANLGLWERVAFMTPDRYYILVTYPCGVPTYDNVLIKEVVNFNDSKEVEAYLQRIENKGLSPTTVTAIYVLCLIVFCLWRASR